MKNAARSALLIATLALAGSSFVGNPTVAHAQGNDPMIEMARERFQEGVKFFDAKQYDKARAAFLQAYALKHHPAVLLNLAQSELRAGYEADAAEHFAQYLRDNKEATAAERQEAERGLAAAKTKVGEVTVSVDEAGAEVFVDGQPKGSAPLQGPVYLAPGSHAIEARKSGKTATATVTTTAGTATTAVVNFGGGGAAAPPATAAPPGIAPPAGDAPPSDAAPEDSDGTSPPADEGTPGKREPVFKWAKHRPVAWVGAGFTALGLVGGISWAIGASVAYSDADKIAQDIRGQPNGKGACSDPTPYFQNACEKYQTHKDSGDSQKTMSIVSFVVAGLAATGTVAYYFIDSKPKSAAFHHSMRPRASVVPLLSPQVSGIGVFGQF